MHTSKHNGTSPGLHATCLVVAIYCATSVEPVLIYHQQSIAIVAIVSGPELVQSTFISCKAVVASHDRPFSNISSLNLHWHGSSAPVLVILQLLYASKQSWYNFNFIGANLYIVSQCRSKSGISVLKLQWYSFNIPVLVILIHCAKTYIPTTWESIGYADGNVLNPAN